MPLANLQIFGTRKCSDTRKAERFFKERRTTQPASSRVKSRVAVALASVGALVRPPRLPHRSHMPLSTLMLAILVAAAAPPTSQDCKKAEAEYKAALDSAAECKTTSECSLYSTDVFLVEGTGCPLFVNRSKRSESLGDLENALAMCGIPRASCGGRPAKCVNERCIAEPLKKARTKTARGVHLR
jgi:hypothetical protein